MGTDWLWEDLTLFMGTDWLWEVEDLILFLWERIDCGRLILFVGGFKYHMKIKDSLSWVEHSTNILVKKVPDGVSHEDDLKVGVVPLGSRLVLYLKQDAQCVLHRHLKCRWICSPSCSLRGWWDGTPRCTAAAALSAAIETCQKKTQLDGAFLGKRSMTWKTFSVGELAAGEAP